jgi:hypothetical protein
VSKAWSLPLSRFDRSLILALFPQKLPESALAVAKM